MLVRIAKREDPGQTASNFRSSFGLGLHFLSWPFKQACVQNLEQLRYRCNIFMQHQWPHLVHQSL